MSLRPTVVVVDDHVRFRSAARALLEAAEYVVVGEASNGEVALELVAKLQPEVVLLDIQIPGLDGFEVAWRLAARADPPAVVLVSSREAASYGARLRHLPVRGFITKSMLSGEALDMLVR